VSNPNESNSVRGVSGDVRRANVNRISFPAHVHVVTAARTVLVAGLVIYSVSCGKFESVRAISDDESAIVMLKVLPATGIAIEASGSVQMPGLESWTVTGKGQRIRSPDGSEHLMIALQPTTLPAAHGLGDGMITVVEWNVDRRVGHIRIRGKAGLDTTVQLHAP
jgi:hypothetical protein